MKRLSLVFIALAFVSNSVLAGLCDSKETSEGTESFAQSFQAAKSLARELCFKIVDANLDNSSEIKRKADSWKQAALAEAEMLKAAGIDLAGPIEQIYQEILDGEPYVALQVSRSPAHFFRLGNAVPTAYDNNACKTLAAGQDCFTLLSQLGKVTQTINSSTNVKTLEEAYKNLGLYSRSWSEYFSEARSQTFIELSLNTWLYKDELQRGVNVPPPDWQAIFLHPGAAIEYVSDAPDGDQQSEVLVMEWVGFNFWNASLPWGVSIISAYSDRASGDDHAYGLMVHIDNKYSIAYTDRDEGEGILVTLDLLKFFEDKQSNLENYKDDIEEYIK